MTFEDEFDGLESLELTNEEWALVDTQVASTLQAFQLKSREPRGMSPPVPPRLRRQYYTSTCARRPEYPYRMQAARATARGLHRPDLFTAFRPTGSLSVSDLVGPAWCEVKFDYNLRWGRKWERVEQKPEALVTSKGKRIEVRKSDARKGEAIKDAGVAIHKKLESVLQPTQIEIPVTTKEERWGSKLLTMLSSLQLLRTVGYCREFPVMGFIDEILVIGIIDEIVRRPRDDNRYQLAAQGDDSIHRTGSFGMTLPSPCEQTTVPQSSDPAEPQCRLKEGEISQQRPFEGVPGYSLHLIDHKSRNSRSTPPVRDQYQSRLQLMLYKRLLSALLEPSSFLDIMSRLQVETSAPFSPAFLQTQEYLCVSNDLDNSVRSAMCLGDLMLAWGEYLTSLDIGWELPTYGSSAVTDQLELVYRLREMPKTSRRRSTVSRDPSLNGNANPCVDEHTLNPDRSSVGEVPKRRLSLEYFERDWEDLAIAWAIQESLEAAEQNATVFGPALEEAMIPLPESPASTQGATELPPLPESEAQIMLNRNDLPPTNSDSLVIEPQDKQTGLASFSNPSEDGLAPIVGISKFLYDEQELDEYVVDVMKFWRGLREPRGVDIEDVKRCNTCEFRDGCEWREAKAAGFEQIYAEAAAP